METSWPQTADLDAMRAASALVREQRTRTLDELRDAPSTRSSRIRGARVVLRTPPELERARVLHVLRACRHVEEVRARKMMRAAGVEHDARLEDLEHPQRGALAGSLLALTRPAAQS